MARILRIVFFLLIGLVYLGAGFPYADLFIAVAAIGLALFEAIGGG